MASPKKKKSSGDKAEANKPSTLSDQLDRAAASIELNAFQMQALHTQWRKYLTLLSYLVAILSFHQMHMVSASCLKDIKSVSSNGDTIISGWQATALVLKDSASIVLSIVMSILLCLFLRVAGESANFSHPLFLTAQSCILPILGIQYYYSQKGVDLSCLDVGGIAYNADDLPLKTEQSKKTLPAVLVFHVIVVVCLYFIKKQQQTLRKNEIAIMQLRNELNEATAKGKEKKKK